MNLQPMLTERGIDFELHAHAPTLTPPAGCEEPVSGVAVAKPVIVKGASAYTMCVLPARARVDLTQVAQVLHDPEVRLATEAEKSKLFPGCELGAEPPMGALFGMNTLMDERLCDDDRLVMSTGRRTESVTLRRADWQRLCEPVVAPIAEG